MNGTTVAQKTLDYAAVGGGFGAWWVTYVGVVNQTIGVIAGLLSIAFLAHRFFAHRARSNQKPQTED